MGGAAGLYIGARKGEVNRAPEYEKDEDKEDPPSCEIPHHFKKGGKGLIRLCGALSGFKDKPGPNAKVARQRKYRCEALQSGGHRREAKALWCRFCGTLVVEHLGRGTRPKGRRASARPAPWAGASLTFVLRFEGR